MLGGAMGAYDVKNTTLIPEMIFVEGGRFMMGCTNEQGVMCSEDEKPVHMVMLDDFEIGKFEVTLEQFAAFVTATKYTTDGERMGESWANDSVWRYVKGVNWRHTTEGKRKPIEEYHEYPVLYVSWNDAIAYCNWLSQETGETYRLPTEAEWEYAARGGQESKGYRYAGADKLKEVGWYFKNSGYKVNKIGQKKANELGIHDMSGNVWEWVSDWYAEGYYTRSETDKPIGPEHGQLRVLRGGCWRSYQRYGRVSYRLGDIDTRSYAYFGFRVVRELP